MRFCRFPIKANLPGSRRSALLHRNQGAFHTLKEDLVVKRGFRSRTKGDHEIHEVRILRCPLESLGPSHRPANNGAQMRDAHVLGNELMLRPHIVVK